MASGGDADRGALEGRQGSVVRQIDWRTRARRVSGFQALVVRARIAVHHVTAHISARRAHRGDKAGGDEFDVDFQTLLLLPMLLDPLFQPTGAITVAKVMIHDCLSVAGNIPEGEYTVFTVYVKSHPVVAL